MRPPRAPTGAGIRAAAFCAVLALPGLQAAPARAVSNGQQAGSFLLIASGARAAAMGEAFTALADDVTAVTWNPAGLAALPGLEATLSYADWFADTSYSSVALGLPIASGHVIAVQLHYFNVPAIENVPADVEPAVELSNWAAGPAYAIALGDHWSAGAGLKFLSSGVSQSGRPESAADAAVFDLGVLYRRSSPDLRGGIAAQNMGARLKFRDARSPAPFWLRAGLAWGAYRDEFLSVKLTADASQPVETGWRLSVPEGGLSQIFKASLDRPYQNRYNYAVGTEWSIGRLLALRAGWTFRVGSDIDSPSAGAGFRFSTDRFEYRVDYAYAYWADLSTNVSRVSFTMGIRPGPGAGDE